jgi:hypothetical protein
MVVQGQTPGSHGQFRDSFHKVRYSDPVFFLGSSCSPNQQAGGRVFMAFTIPHHAPREHRLFRMTLSVLLLKTI